MNVCCIDLLGQIPPAVRGLLISQDQAVLTLPELHDGTRSSGLHSTRTRGFIVVESLFTGWRPTPSTKYISCTKFREQCACYFGKEKTKAANAFCDGFITYRVNSGFYHYLCDLWQTAILSILSVFYSKQFSESMKLIQCCTTYIANAPKLS